MPIVVLHHLYALNHYTLHPCLRVWNYKPTALQNSLSYNYFWVTQLFNQSRDKSNSLFVYLDDVKHKQFASNLNCRETNLKVGVLDVVRHEPQELSCERHEVLLQLVVAQRAIHFVLDSLHRQSFAHVVFLQRIHHFIGQQPKQQPVCCSRMHTLRIFNHFLFAYPFISLAFLFCFLNYCWDYLLFWWNYLYFFLNYFFLLWFFLSQSRQFFC